MSSASENLSDALGSIGATDTAPATGSASASASATDSSASASGSDSESTSASASQTVAESQSLTDAPSLGTSSASVSASVSQINGLPSLTNAPTLSGYYSYPAPTVPPIAGAPYMQKTNLPENFVFIVVGACIAFFALLVIGWRILTSWSINRRFQRHERGNTGAGGKASYMPLTDFKQKPPVASNHDMKDMGNLPKNFSSVPSLFFSPTAEVARHSMRPDSRGHLPAGHYRDASRT